MSRQSFISRSKKIGVSAIILAIFGTASGQNLVMLHHQGKASVFTGTQAFNNAHVAATDGDTIYLSNGFWPGTDITKKLCIYGPGIFRDSTRATGRGGFSSGISLSKGASNSRLEGFEVLGSIWIGRFDSLINIQMRRLYFEGLAIGGNLSKGLNRNIQLSESVVNGSIDGTNQSTQVLVNNNIIYGTVANFDQGLALENNFLPYSATYNYTLTINNCLIRNNVFGYAQTCCYSLLNGTGNKFYNNSVGIVSYFHPSNDTSKIYVVRSDSALISANLNYNSGGDFHLKSKWVGKLKGTDGKDIGIYGGYYTSAKDGWVPVIPRIETVNIDPATDTAGKLKVQMKVNAQKR